MTGAGGALAAFVVAILAYAGVAAADTPGAPVTAVAMTAGKARPAEGGGRASAATLGPLAIGAAVRDRTGVEIGRVTRLTTDKAGRSIAEIRQDEAVFWVPVDQLYAVGGRAFSTASLNEIKRDDAAP